MAPASPLRRVSLEIPQEGWGLVVCLFLRLAPLSGTPVCGRLYLELCIDSSPATVSSFGVFGDFLRELT